jgi:hypothetical protein
VLGPTESRFREVRRPYLGGLPGRIGFNLDFAAVPHPSPYPGLCEADIVSVYFGPEEGNPDPNQAMTETSRLRFPMFRLMDTGHPPAPREQIIPPSEAVCAAAGPVLSSDDRIARRTRFFDVGQGDHVLNALQTYLTVRALRSIVGRARGGQLPVIDCSAEGHVCDNPRHLLAHLPMERFNGFSLAPCADYGPQVCVEASFSPDLDPNSNLILLIRIETVSAHLDTPTADISARHIHIEESRPID